MREDGRVDLWPALRRWSGSSAARAGRVLCVVVVATCAWGKGEGCSPACNQTGKCAMSYVQVAPDHIGDFRACVLKSIVGRGMAEPPAMIIFGLVRLLRALRPIIVEQMSSLAHAVLGMALNHFCRIGLAWPRGSAWPPAFQAHAQNCVAVVAAAR